jgi:hypothetical protein
MRHYLIILMIALLPLRSWAGDVMAVSMATQVVTSAGADVAAQRASADVKDCAGHSGSHSETTTAGADVGLADDGHCKTCVTCQICHSVALVSLDVLTSGAPEASRLKSPSAATFASAPLADSVKPPIS